MLRKAFGGIRMTWARLILFAAISGIVTGLIALLVPEGNSIRQIAVTLEAWIVLAIIVVVNCEKPVEAACKTFVFFLISQPLVYLIQVPFNRMGFGLFGYYTYWLYWTIATFPGGFIAWYIKRDNWLSALILSAALTGLIFFGAGYLRQLTGHFPKYLISTVFCFGMVPVLISVILHRRIPRLIASVIAAAAFIALMFFTFRDGISNSSCSVTISLDGEKYAVTEGWTAELEDPENGTVDLFIGDGIISSGIHLEIRDIEKNTTVLFTDPDGETWRFPVEIEKDGNGYTFSY